MDATTTTTPSPVDEALGANPALLREICESLGVGRRIARRKMVERGEKIEAAADWLLDNIRIGDGPGTDSATAREAYLAATGATIGILEFITAAVLAGYPATVVKRTTATAANPTVRKRTFFCFHFNPADVAEILRTTVPQADTPRPVDENSGDRNRRSLPN